MSKSPELDFEDVAGSHIEAVIVDQILGEFDRDVDPALLTIAADDADAWMVPPAEAELPVIHGIEKSPISRICERQARCALVMAGVVII